MPASGEIVFVGYGISAPDKGLDEYAGVDVKDKIVMAFKGSPKDAPAARGMFGVVPPEPRSTEAWTAESTPVTKIIKAYEKGAAAILLFDPTRRTSGSLMGGPAPAPAMVAGFGIRAYQDCFGARIYHRAGTQSNRIRAALLPRMSKLSPKFGIS